MVCQPGTRRGSLIFRSMTNRADWRTPRTTWHRQQTSLPSVPSGRNVPHEEFSLLAYASGGSNDRVRYYDAATDGRQTREGRA
jgi:hypothetical protein